MDPPAAHYSMLEASRPALIQALEAAGMSLVCHLPTFVSTADLTDSIRRASIQETVRSLETAAGLQAEKAVLHPGHIRGMGAFVRPQALELALESIEIILEAAERLDITVCLENMFPGYGAFFEGDEVGLVLDRFPRLAMTLDTGHANIGSPRGRRIQALISRFGSRIAHVHVSDNHGEADEHLPLGKGSIDFKAVVKTLTAMGYDGTVTLEIFTDDRRDLTAGKKLFSERVAAYRPRS
jgi:sugar phosphate isomerase/epimerase